MTERFKIKIGKTMRAAKTTDVVRFFKKDNALHVHSDAFFTKRYVKYLTKKYLKKQELKDYLRVISVGNKPHKRAYELRYYNIAGEEKKEQTATEETQE